MIDKEMIERENSSPKIEERKAEGWESKERQRKRRENRLMIEMPTMFLFFSPRYLMADARCDVNTHAHTHTHTHTHEHTLT